MKWWLAQNRKKTKKIIPNVKPTIKPTKAKNARVISNTKLGGNGFERDCASHGRPAFSEQGDRHDRCGVSAWRAGEATRPQSTSIAATLRFLAAIVLGRAIQPQPQPKNWAGLHAEGTPESWFTAWRAPVGQLLASLRRDTLNSN